MNTLKKCDANNCQGANHNIGRHSFRQMGQSGRANSSKTKPDGAWEGRLTFVDDFTREHTHPDLHLASIEISGIF